MLLAEFMKLAHATTADDREVPVDLNQVTSFEFGDKYLIRMRSGKTLDVRDIDDILDIMRTEFTVWQEQWVPEALIVSASKQSFVAKDRYLSVTAVQKSGFLPAIPPDAAIERVRLAVTMFNLTGSWDQFNKSNL
jgi:hypothetical protein